MLTDEQLMLDYLHGSGPALEELFSRYKHSLYAFFRRRLASKHRSEDLTQETFLVVIRNANRYEPRALFRTYLYGIAMNLVSAERRKRGRTEEEITDFVSPTEDISEPGLWVRQALRKLSPDDREILMLREYEQLSYVEIATLLKIPVNTVRSRLFRSRLALKAQLEPDKPAVAGRN
jgi:RNA polymerase sigma-70 factor, ECF subfamily